ncbi:MAG: YggS family pyridoxal phosphate-dependent enzyme [Clostridia bacterium]|nr:YggS family pyridoxal phosphate-dependent enzyme [Clostridia bacterium]
MTEKLSTEAVFRGIDENYKRIRETVASAAVRSGRTPEEVRFMAVTKTVPPVFINHALSLGVDLIGENKVQELLSKLDSLQPPEVEKHLIGHLQTNKVAKILPHVSMIQSVDSVRLAEAIDKAAEKLGGKADILLEVNVGDEESKTGFPFDGFEENVYRIASFPHLRVRGIMTIPPFCEKKEDSRRFFCKVSKLFIDIKGKNIDNITMDTLSMGMSSDFEEAILEGATLVRVGTALFGGRRY